MGAYWARPKLQEEGSWNVWHVGVNVHKSIRSSAILMGITRWECCCFPALLPPRDDACPRADCHLCSLSYLAIQGPAFGVGCGEGTCHRASSEHWWSFAGLVMCCIFFTGYMWYQVRGGILRSRF